ncbi:hypothetical protein G7046_g4793 [Stylonectria norvegica]|nr:hypothetical protein G7046_g4793 [Stylonectria norvegica]
MTPVGATWAAVVPCTGSVWLSGGWTCQACQAGLGSLHGLRLELRLPGPLRSCKDLWNPGFQAPAAPPQSGEPTLRVDGVVTLVSRSAARRMAVNLDLGLAVATLNVSLLPAPEPPKTSSGTSRIKRPILPGFWSV